MTLFRGYLDIIITQLERKKFICLQFGFILGKYTFVSKVGNIREDNLLPVLQLKGCISVAQIYTEPGNV